MVQLSPAIQQRLVHTRKRDDGILRRESYKSLSDGFDALMNQVSFVKKAAHPW